MENNNNNNHTLEGEMNEGYIQLVHLKKMDFLGRNHTQLKTKNYRSIYVLHPQKQSVCFLYNGLKKKENKK